MNVATSARLASVVGRAAPFVAAMLLAGCAAQEAEVEEVVSPPDEPVVEEGPFATDTCYRKHFSLAEAMPKETLPAEVKLYCLANWDFSELHKVRVALDSSNFDLVAALVRSADENKKEALQTILRMSMEQADSGPEGLGDIWYLHKVMPALDALHKNSEDVKVVESQFGSEDVAALRSAVSKIDWERPIEISDGAGSAGAAEGKKPRLVADLGAEVLRLSQR